MGFVYCSNSHRYYKSIFNMLFYSLGIRDKRNHKCWHQKEENQKKETEGFFPYCRQARLYCLKVSIHAYVSMSHL